MIMAMSRFYIKHEMNVELEHGSERRSAGTDRAGEARVDCST